MYSWKDGALLSKPTLTTIGASPTEICGGSPNRYGVIMCPALSSSITLGNDNTVAYGSGIILAIGTLPLVMLYETWGEMVRRPWWGITNAPSPFVFIEIMLG